MLVFSVFSSSLIDQTVNWVMKTKIYCLISNFKKVKFSPEHEIIVGCHHDQGWSLTVGFSLLDCLAYLSSALELLLPPISQTAWASCVRSLSGECVTYKRVQPVSAWRQVWGYLRKVLKHAWWQDDRTTSKRERRGEGEVSEKAVYYEEKVKEKVCEVGFFFSFRQWRKWCEW